MKRGPSLLTLFLFSGVSGLVYEIVWLRILVRALGCTVTATSTVLSAFMAGLALGSYFLGRTAQRLKRPLRFYALLELGVGLTALIVPWLIHRLIPFFQWSFAQDPSSFHLIRFCSVFFVLLLPTSLMGGTLPVLSRIAESQGNRETGSWLGLLYGVNTLGAVIGTAACGFVLIGSIGEQATVILGVLINLLVAAVAYAMDRGEKPLPITPPDSPQKALGGWDRFKKLLLIAFAFSGFTALGYEVIWTRILQFFLGTTVYAFSAMLSLYLLGIAAGSFIGKKILGRASAHPVALAAAAQLGICFFALAGAHLLPLCASEAFVRITGRTQNLLTAALLILPVTLCFGASFPLISQAFLNDLPETSRAAGVLYAGNTLGAIFGSLGAGFLLLPALGSAGSICALANVNLILAVVLMLMSVGPKPVLSWKAAFPMAGLLTCLILVKSLGDPFFEITQARMAKKVHGGAVVALHAESASGTTTAFGCLIHPHSKHLWINGVGVTGLVSETKLMAHLPLLLCENPKKMLVICFGMGTTTRSAFTYPGLEIDTVELIPEVYRCFPFYHADAEKIVQDPRVHTHVDDGRNFLLMHPTRYDVITIDPAPPLESAGSVNLYTAEFFSLCRSRLNPGGAVCVWIPLSGAAETRMIMRAFQSAFPEATVWKSPHNAGYYLIGMEKALEINRERFAKAFRDKVFVADLTEWERVRLAPETLTSLKLLDAQELKAYVQDSPVNTDDRPYTEFPLWRRTFHAQTDLPLNTREIEAWKISRSAGSTF